MLVNTGMRPVEAMGLELDDVLLDRDIPHVHVRKNATRGLRTARLRAAPVSRLAVLSI